MYRIPEGFHLSSVPTDIDLHCGFFSLQRSCAVKDKEIHVSQTKRLRRIQLPQEDYPKVKEFFSNLDSSTKQRIVLTQDGRKDE